MAQDKFDLVIIGAGPGGYVAAVRAAQLGFKTAVVEKEERLGGVCLNVGCIPSKALLDSSEYYHLAKAHFGDHGIKIGQLECDLPAMMTRKDQVVTELTGQVRKLLEGHKISIFHGTAKVAGPGKVDIRASDDDESPITLETGNILLATGSEPVRVPGLDLNPPFIVDSTGILSLDRVPEHLLVVGGGYIGLELGSVWLRLGSRVTVVEMLPKIATTLDGQVGRTLERILKGQGFVIKSNTRVADASRDGDRIRVTLDSGGEETSESCDCLLVAVGRRPLTRGLGLEEIGLNLDERSGRVSVDENYQTNVKGIYAIGDLIAGPMLAHKASAEGIAAVECMAGQPGEVNYDTIPAIVYTWPEVASVGLTEEQVKERDIPYCTGTYPFSGAGRARCMGEKDGFVKLIAQSVTDRILGVHIIGPRAADMIAECVLAIEMGASSEDIARTVHGHPTFSEALMEAAMSARNCSIYAS